jgi:UDP-N-acetylglucosamine:LPS N-acetylglucosamine transferase
MKRVLFIASTGGHLEELLTLQPLFTSNEYCIVTENTGSTCDALRAEYGGRIHFLLFGTREKPFAYPFKLLCNAFLSLRIFIRFNPDAIVSTGAHTAVSMLLIGRIFRRRIVFIETVASVRSKSATGNLAYRLADLFLVQWPEMLELYPHAEYRGRLL